MNMKRMRGRSHRSGGGGGNNGGGGGGGGGTRNYNGNIPLIRNHVFDSSGPDIRVRGTAQQLFEKYLQLGRDAASSGDRVMAEGYFQHAEHYFRIVNAINQAAQQNPQNYQAQQGQAPQQPQGGHQGGQYNGQRRPPNEEYQPDQEQPQQGYGEQPSLEVRDIPIAAVPEA